MPIARQSVSRIARRALVAVLLLVLYLASIPFTLMGLYVLKEYVHINVLSSGGWHHFNACLMQEIGLTERDYRHNRYGAITPAVPVLVGLGVMSLSPTDPSPTAPLSAPGARPAL